MPAITDQVPAIHHSFWTKHTELHQRFPRLENAHETDVLIIGGGITGLSLADELTSRSGMRVTVCDANVIGGGTTGASSGHLDPHPEMGPVELQRRLGVTDARNYISLRLKAIDKIMQRADNAVEIATVNAYQYTETIPQLPSLREECKVAQQLGLPATWCDDIPMHEAVGGYRIAGLGRIDSLQYVVNLAEKLASRGVEIFELSQVASPADKHPNSLIAGHGTVDLSMSCARHTAISPTPSGCTSKRLPTNLIAWSRGLRSHPSTLCFGIMRIPITTFVASEPTTTT